jgi:hypothetical protein
LTFLAVFELKEQTNAASKHFDPATAVLQNRGRAGFNCHRGCRGGGFAGDALALY